MFDDVESDGAVGEDEPCFLREDVVDAAIFVVSAVSPGGCSGIMRKVSIPFVRQDLRNASTPTNSCDGLSPRRVAQASNAFAANCSVTL